MFAEIVAAFMTAEWISHLLLIIARLSFVIFLMPGIGEQVIPAQVRAIVIVSLSISIASAVPPPNVLPGRPDAYAAALFQEITFGLAIGVGMRLAIWVLSITGSIIAQSIGLAQFLGVALDNEAQPIVSNLLTMAGATLFLSANLHVEVFATLIEVFANMPIAESYVPDRDAFMQRIFAAFGFATLLSWPFVVANLIYNVCLGFINKALPQLMVAFVGAPFMVGAGLLLLMTAIATLLTVWSGQLQQFIQFE